VSERAAAWWLPAPRMHVGVRGVIVGLLVGDRVRGIFSRARTLCMERMLLSASKMNRKPLALAIVLLLTGLAPVATIIGFCTRMPCCNHASGRPLAFSTEAHDCCTTITCYEPPCVKLTNGVAASDALLATPVLVHVAVAPPPQRIAAAGADTSPPIHTRHRLAILSTLLI